MSIARRLSTLACAGLLVLVSACSDDPDPTETVAVETPVATSEVTVEDPVAEPTDEPTLAEEPTGDPLDEPTMEPVDTPTTDEGTDTDTDAKPPADGHSDDLERIVAEAEAQIPQVMDMYPGVYSDVQILAEQPDTIVYTYTFANQLDPETARTELEAGLTELEDTVHNQVFPGMAAEGVEPTQKARYEYYNADGSEIWQVTFSSEDR